MKSVVHKQTHRELKHIDVELEWEKEEDGEVGGWGDVAVCQMFARKRNNTLKREYAKILNGAF